MLITAPTGTTWLTLQSVYSDTNSRFLWWWFWLQTPWIRCTIHGLVGYCVLAPRLAACTAFCFASLYAVSVDFCSTSSASVYITACTAASHDANSAGSAAKDVSLPGVVIITYIWTTKGCQLGFLSNHLLRNWAGSPFCLFWRILYSEFIRNGFI